MNRLHLSLGVLTVAGAAAFACGGISDPRRVPENTSTVSGALTGTAVPSGAHVALVWRVGKSGGYAVGSDAPIVDGKFTMTLGALPDAYYFSPEGDGNDVITEPSGPNTDPPPDIREEGPAQDGQKQWQQPSQKLAPRDQASGSITQPLSIAVAGFVVYVDANGNGKLDLEGSHAGTPDQILGGNATLVLANFKGGGTLDYEKMRDKSGIAPAPGYNLFWDDLRFVPLNLVELKLSSTSKLPTSVCRGATPPPDTLPPAPVPVPAVEYPSPDDPGLHCSDDGRSYTYTPLPTHCMPTPPPAGLCSGDGEDVPQCAGTYPSDKSLGPTDPVPAGWPCPLPFGEARDGGPAPIHDGGPVLDGGP